MGQQLPWQGGQATKGAKEPAGRSLEPASHLAGRASELAGRVLKPTGRPFEPAERPLEPQNQLRAAQSLDASMEGLRTSLGASYPDFRAS